MSENRDDKSTSRSDVAHLWEDYSATRSQDARDRLIIHYAPLVKFVAGRVASGLPRSVEQAELVSNGIFGLMDAINRFEPERGFKFETYAMSRIRGAMIDALRSYDWVPRSVRAKARQLERATAVFESRHHRPPTDAELGEMLGLTVEAVRTAMRQVAASGVLALDDPFGGDGGENLTLGDLVTDGEDDPVEEFEHEEQRHVIAQQIDRLPQREKLVLALYYYEGMNLADIGKVLGVTESRICQIHTKAVLHLKARLAAVNRDVGALISRD